MIPTISDILQGLHDGEFTSQQAEAWITEHLKMARETGEEDLRDWLAGMALQGLLACPSEKLPGNFSYHEAAYLHADAMLEARKK